VYCQAADGAIYLSQNRLTYPAKALTIKIIHAYHHRKADDLNGDDVTCLRRTLFEILLDIKHGRALLQGKDNAQELLAKVDSVRSVVGAMYTQLQNKITAIFLLNPIKDPEDRYDSDSVRDFIQKTQLQQYSITCSSRAGILSFNEILFLVALMIQTGWIADLNLSWYFRASCNCKLMDTWGPEARQAAMLQAQQEAAREQAATRAQQADLVLHGAVVSQESRHEEGGG